MSQTSTVIPPPFNIAPICSLFLPVQCESQDETQSSDFLQISFVFHSFPGSSIINMCILACCFTSALFPRYFLFNLSELCLLFWRLTCLLKAQSAAPTCKHISCCHGYLPCWKVAEFAAKNLCKTASKLENSCFFSFLFFLFFSCRKKAHQRI